MGFLPASISGFTCVNDLSITWTDLGRKYLISRKEKERTLVYFFSLSDRDKDYTNVFEPESGFVPDLTGDHNRCLPATFSNIILNPIQVEGDVSSSVSIIDYRTKSLKTCIGGNGVDCSKYYDMYPLDSTDPRSSEVYGASIWECIIGDFMGTLT